MDTANTRVLFIDLQYDFTREGGKEFKPRPCVDFIRKTAVPFLMNNPIEVAEIVSDYRQPRPGDRGDCCHPGEWGYTSEIHENLKRSWVWIKCMNSPVWTRRSAGHHKKEPELPHPAPEAFGSWTLNTLGNPGTTVVLAGLTLDCCVLCAAQELNWRGYDVKILREGTDTYSGSAKEKEYLLSHPPITNWATPISWKMFTGG